MLATVFFGEPQKGDWPQLAPGNLQQELVRGPWSLDWEVVQGVFFHHVDSIRKVRTSVSASSTCTSVPPDDAAAKVTPPRQTSTRNSREEVLSPGSMMMASQVLKPAVSSKARAHGS